MPSNHLYCRDHYDSPLDSKPSHLEYQDNPAGTKTLASPIDAPKNNIQVALAYSKRSMKRLDKKTIRENRKKRYHHLNRSQTPLFLKVQEENKTRHFPQTRKSKKNRSQPSKIAENKEIGEQRDIKVEETWCAFFLSNEM